LIFFGIRTCINEINCNFAPLLEAMRFLRKMFFVRVLILGLVMALSQDLVVYGCFVLAGEDNKAHKLFEEIVKNAEDSEEKKEKEGEEEKDREEEKKELFAERITGFNCLEDLILRRLENQSGDYCEGFLFTEVIPPEVNNFFALKSVVGGLRLESYAQ